MKNTESLTSRTTEFDVESVAKGIVITLFDLADIPQYQRENLAGPATLFVEKELWGKIIKPQLWRFDYKCLDRDSQVHAGSIEATSRTDAEKLLMQRYWKVVVLSERY